MDAEPHDTLPDGVLEAVASGGEQARLAALTAAGPGVCWDRLLFSAKESVYKAWFPLTRRWLGFEEACVDFDPASGSFTARLLVDGPVVNGARRHRLRRPMAGQGRPARHRDSRHSSRDRGQPRLIRQTARVPMTAAIASSTQAARSVPAACPSTAERSADIAQ